MKVCAGLFQAVLRRRDNIQAEFQAKNEALMSWKGDKEAVSAHIIPSHSHREDRTHAASLHPCFPLKPATAFECPPIIFREISFNKVKRGVGEGVEGGGALPQGHPSAHIGEGAEEKEEKKKQPTGFLGGLSRYLGLSAGSRRSARWE